MKSLIGTPSTMQVIDQPSMMTLIDTHAHLDDPAFAGDLPEVIARARAAEVETIVAIGTTPASSEAVIALAERFREVVAAIGIHPHEAGRTAQEDLDALATLSRHSRVVAIGETGLDYYRDYAPHGAQAALFHAHLDLARRTGLPVVIHCRDAFEDTLGILAEYDEVPVIMHAFSGSVEIAGECVRRGYSLSLGGPLTFRNARRAVEVAQAVPADHLLLETDAPLLAPHPHRGRRNEPAYLTFVATRVAEVRGESPEMVSDYTTRNARSVFHVVAGEVPA